MRQTVSSARVYSKRVLEWALQICGMKTLKFTNKELTESERTLVEIAYHRTYIQWLCLCHIQPLRGWRPFHSGKKCPFCAIHRLHFNFQEKNSGNANTHFSLTIWLLHSKTWRPVGIISPLMTWETKFDDELMGPVCFLEVSCLWWSQIIFSRSNVLCHHFYLPEVRMMMKNNASKNELALAWKTME